MSSRNFGSFFKKCRIQTGQSLRMFCKENKFDPGNISRLERSRFSPPTSEEKLSEYAEALNIIKGSDDWFTFFDLAAAAKGRIPNDLMSDEEVVGKLPALFRILRGDSVSQEDLDQLIERIRET